jgi:hypothetical protein
MVGLSWVVHGDGRTGRLGRFQSEARLARGWGVREIEKGEGKEEASWARLRFQLGFGLLPNRN